MKYMRQSKTFHFEEHLFRKGALGIAKIMHEALLLRKILQTKPQMKNRVIQ